MAKVDAELKAKWVAALRSGEYQQGKFVLHDSASKTYCCLGVLGRLIGKSDAEMDRDGLPTSWGLLPEIDTKTLAYEWNDAKAKSFPEIADYIEANL